MDLRELDLAVATLADETEIVGRCIIVDADALLELQPEAIGAALQSAARNVQAPADDLPGVDWERVAEDLGVGEVTGSPQPAGRAVTGEGLVQSVPEPCSAHVGMHRQREGTLMAHNVTAPP